MLLAPEASAATAIVDDQTRVVTYRADPGEANRLLIERRRSSDLVFSDQGAPVTPGSGCRALAARTVLCVGARVQILLGDGDDRVETGDLQTGPQSVVGDTTLDGGSGDDLLLGGSGGDVLVGGAGADEVVGGAGADRVSYARELAEGSSAATTSVTADLDGARNDGTMNEGDRIAADVEAITGGDGDDSLSGNDGPNTLEGGPAGNDSLAGGAGADMLRGGSGDDTLAGGDGDDVLEGGLGRDVSGGGDGSDRASYDEEVSEGSKRTIVATLNGQADDGASGENDAIATDVEGLIGGLGRDRLIGNGDVNHISDPKTAQIEGLGGSDILEAGDGNNTLDGGPGDDSLDDGGSRDVLIGGEGDDSIQANGDSGSSGLGFDGFDRVDGGPGDDRIEARETDNFIGAGEDGLDLDSFETPALDEISCGSGSDLVETNGPDALRSCERLNFSGSTRGDRVAGLKGDDSIFGESGRDLLAGGGGNDRIDGGDDFDRLSGGRGNDRIGARDGWRDRIRCGPGRDRVTADRRDVVARDCERVSRRN